MYKGIVTIYLGILKSFAQFTMSSNSQALKPWMGKWSPAATPGGGFPGKRGPCTGCGCGEKNNFIEKPGFVVLFTWKRYHLRAPIREMVGSGKNRWIRARFTLKYPFALYSGFEEKV